MLSTTASQNRHERRAAAKAVSLPEKLNFTIKEACHVSGISRSKLYEDIKAGRLSVFKVGRRTLVAADDLASWIASYRAA